MSRIVVKDATEVASQQSGNLNGSVSGKESGAAVGNGTGPLPRPARQRRRAKADRGLPPDEDLANLARAYLTRQRVLWPNLVSAGLLPESTPAVVHWMVTNFKER